MARRQRLRTETDVDSSCGGRWSRARDQFRRPEPLITRPGRPFAAIPRSTSQISRRSGVFIPQIRVDRAEEILDLLLQSDRRRRASHEVKTRDAAEPLRSLRRDQRPTGCRTLRATFWRLESCNQRGSTRLWRQARRPARAAAERPDSVPGRPSVAADRTGPIYGEVEVETEALTEDCSGEHLLPESSAASPLTTVIPRQRCPRAERTFPHVQQPFPRR